MYNIQNESLTFYYWRTLTQKSYLIGNEKDLIKWIASYFKVPYWGGSELFNIILDNFSCKDSDVENQYIDKYIIFDGIYRYINPKNYEREARIFYLKYLKNSQGDKYNYFFKNKSKKEYGVFRKTPVPGIHKYRGGPKQKPRKIKHIEMMYDNPDFKDYNRGSAKKIAFDDWYDWFPRRKIQKSWKKHRKHQWK